MYTYVYVCVCTYIYIYIYIYIYKFHIDVRAQLGGAKSLAEISAAAATLRARRSEESAARSGAEDPARPDRGWYLRYRRPLGNRSAEANTRAERKAAVAAAAAGGAPPESNGDDKASMPLSSLLI